METDTVAAVEETEVLPTGVAPAGEAAWSLDDAEIPDDSPEVVAGRWRDHARWAFVIALVCATGGAAAWLSLVYFTAKPKTAPQAPPAVVAAAPTTLPPPSPYWPDGAYLDLLRQHGFPASYLDCVDDSCRSNRSLNVLMGHEICAAFTDENRSYDYVMGELTRPAEGHTKGPRSPAAAKAEIWAATSVYCPTAHAPPEALSPN